MKLINTVLAHTYRSTNQCADHLACIGAEQNKELVLAIDIPISAREFAIRDSLNIRQALD